MLRRRKYGLASLEGGDGGTKRIVQAKGCTCVATPDDNLVISIEPEIRITDPMQSCRT